MLNIVLKLRNILPKWLFDWIANKYLKQKVKKEFDKLRFADRESISPDEVEEACIRNYIKQQAP